MDLAALGVAGLICTFRNLFSKPGLFQADLRVFHFRRQAARLKAHHKLSLADAFAAGTAMQLGARIVTGDPEFKSISHMVEILWL